jgi:CheY-like chemotaxis protein
MISRAQEENRKYDVVLVDLTLPGIRGADVGQRILTAPSLNGTRLVLMAPIGTRADTKAAVDAGFAACLVKPIRRERLWRSIAAALGIATDLPDDRHRPSGAHTVAEGGLTRLTRVLLTEDNLVNQKVMVRTLEKLGCSVDIANDGSEAVDATRNNTYDIVFMDCEMPVMDGYQATRAIREFEAEGPRTPIVALTANVMNGNKEKCLEAGMDDHVIKPVKRQVLLDVLEKWIQREGATHVGV